MGMCMHVPKQKSGSIIQTTPQIQPSRKIISAQDEEKELTENLRKQTKSRIHIKKKAGVTTSKFEIEDIVDAPNAIITDRPKSPWDVEIIQNSLDHHFIFSSLTPEQRDMVVEQTKHYSVSKNGIVFEQGQPGTNFFVLATGILEVIIDNNQVNTLKSGDSFGELALLHDAARSATIKALENSTLWGITRKTFRTALEAMNSTANQENMQFINSVPLFQILTPGQKEALVSSLNTQKFEVRQRIVNEGDPGDLFYLIIEGSVSVTKEGRELRISGRGDYFGEQSLLYNCLRTASITAITPVKCVAINREKLKNALGEQLQSILYINSQRIALEKSEVFSKLNKDQIEEIIKQTHILSHPLNDIAIPSNTEKGRFLWIILQGELSDGQSNFHPFDCIGDQELLNPNEGFFENDVIAQEDVILGKLSKMEIETILGTSIQKAATQNEAMQVLKGVSILKNLSVEKLRSLIDVLKVVDYFDGEIIVRQNDPGDSFFIVKDGIVEIYKDDHIVRTIAKYDYFGERSALFNEVRSATVKAKGNVACWVLHQTEFLNLIDSKVRTLLTKRIQLQDSKIKFTDLRVIRTIGKGMFGIVFLVMHKNNRNVFALKTVERKKIDRFSIHANLVLERKILLQLDHIMIVKLVRTFKDEKRLYFLTEFVRGMDLFDVLRKQFLLNELDARFYTACLITILIYLHERDIIYRDLKPENVIIDEDGYPKLIDFGTAKFISGRTYSLVGTPHYMAPEVIICKGYTVAADYWSLGIMLYEFQCGRLPFGEEDNDPTAVYEKILEHDLMFPDWFDKKSSSKNFIKQLLSINPAMRNSGTSEKLKNNPWLSSINWDRLSNKQIKAPFIPTLFDLGLDDFYNPDETADEVISREEALDASLSLRVKHKPPPSTNWDEDF
ncbi:unnamed protein product [Blepharisma stoltei]|uniref:cGMP-dependent protein kinase n=1 Tax=Blepharisma stoltei TaxID=1481888 RepID=A0AAU9K0G7_9CILI|nr:unnamed protein product [Blepharisma stoltei]